jgi:hypothetical protein
MIDTDKNAGSGTKERDVACALGYWAALAAFLGTFAYSAVQILQIARWVRFPLDAILIYGTSLCIPVPFVLSLLALHYLAPPEKRIWSHAGLLFSAIYAMYVSLNYVVQLATVIPQTLRGEGAAIRLLDQSPHSLFWDVDALGYIFMGLATLCAARVFARNGVQGWARMFFIANGLVVPLISVVYFYPVFSTALLLLGTPWILTANGSTALLFLFFRTERSRMEKPALRPAPFLEVPA